MSPNVTERSVFQPEGLADVPIKNKSMQCFCFYYTVSTGTDATFLILQYKQNCDLFVCSLFRCCTYRHSILGE